MSEPTTAALTADVFEALQAGAPNDQLAAKMFHAAVCLSVEQIGLVPTIDGILAVLACLAEEFPREFAAVKFMHSNNAAHQHWPQA
jgi:hypothetical protein